MFLSLPHLLVIPLILNNLKYAAAFCSLSNLHLRKLNSIIKDNESPFLWHMTSLSTSTIGDNYDEKQGWMKGISNDNKSTTAKIKDGLKVAPFIATLPLYGLGFGILSPKVMWKYSEWVYAIAESPSSDNFLYDHFHRLEAFFDSKRKIALSMLNSYKIHPFFASLSLISTAVLSFVDRSRITNLMKYESLIFINMAICFISAMAAFPLHKIMIGTLHAKKWIKVQAKLSVLYTTLSWYPGTFGRIMIHLNWALLFTTSAIERLYVLCITSQMNIPDRKTFMKHYSPQFKTASLAAIPFGLFTFLFFG